MGYCVNVLCINKKRQRFIHWRAGNNRKMQKFSGFGAVLSLAAPGHHPPAQ
jgi:hypothetical protein